ncbi:MAG: hypothetical protein HYV36_02845 [Lentisphaerae bacterium]|nr:hypothetical protein [Lentisphaerota bacterium]
MTMITKEIVANKIIAVLHHQMDMAELTDWAENAIREGDIDVTQGTAVRDAIARLGLADVRAFGLTWEDCENLLRHLGYRLKVEAFAEA